MKDSPVRLNQEPGSIPTGSRSARPDQTTQSHHCSSACKHKADGQQVPSFPVLGLEGDRHEWLAEVRDYLQARSVTLTTIHSHASGSRDPYSSLSSTSAITKLVKHVLGELNISGVPKEPTSCWLKATSCSKATYTSLVPTPEAEKASLIIVEFDTLLSGKALERLELAVRLTTREARLVLETERRVSAEEMFYHSQKLSCMGQLAGGIAHDFNNLLTVIQGHTGFVEMAAESWNDPKVIESIDLIQNATSQSVGLVKQLLLFSRDQKASFEVLDLNRVITDFAKMVRRMVEETISLELKLEESGSYIRADLGMLSQILMNLVVNSRDAMPEGGEIVIRTSLDQDTEGHEIVRLTISDAGCGIPKDKLAKIFDPFYTTKPKGTGLGLANVAGLVRQHSGKINITSEVGEGTRVELLFPAATACEAKKASNRATSSTEMVPKSIKGSKVLLVEDESAVRKLVRKLLEMHGCTVVEAASGRQALEIWPEVCEEISVVVTDVVMPEGVSGWDLAKELRQRNPDIGILLTSGYNERPEDHGLQDADNIAFLQKPYEAVMLKSNLFDLIQEGKAAS